MIGLCLPFILAAVSSQARPGINVGVASGVVTSHGKTVSGAEVLILEQDGDGLRTVTDKHGRFSIPGPLPAAEHLVARYHGSVSYPVNVGRNARLVLDRKAASISGLVRRDDGKPAVGALVVLSGDFQGAISYSEQLRTDQAGHYSFPVVNGDLDSFTLNVLPDQSGYQESANFYLEPGEIKKVPPIVVRRRDGVVDGVIVDAKGHPVAGATVSPEVGYVLAKSDESGHFHLTGVARGDVTLMAQGPGGSVAEAFTATGKKDAQIKFEASDQNAGQAAQAPPPASSAPQTKVGMKSPELKVSKWVKGTPISIAGSKGKVVLLDFWAVTCGPCIRAFPEVEGLYRKYRQSGLVVAGICFPEAPAKILHLVNDGKLTYPNAIDFPSGSLLPVTASRFPFLGTPTLVVVDRQGRIAWSGYDVEGARHWIRRELGLFR